MWTLRKTPHTPHQAPDRAALRRSSDPTGRCQYTFTVASPEESSCPGRADGAGPNGLQEAFSQVTRERDQLQREKEGLNQQVQQMQRRLTELTREAESLRQKPCLQTLASGGAQRENRPVNGMNTRQERVTLNHFTQPLSGAYQEMKAEVTEVPASPARCFILLFAGCGELRSVGEPVLHRKADSIMGKYGVWLQDPEPQGSVYGSATVWRIDAVGKDVRQLFAYEDMDQFTRGFPTKVLLLPELESTGAALYRGSLLYQRRRSRTLIRYDLTSEAVAARADLPHAGFHGQFPYSWGGYTDIDLAVDEQGLWAVYSTSKAKGAIVISHVANAFMACGRLYTVASYTATNTTINHVFDTATGEGRPLSVPFKNQYRYNSMVDYNHARKMLYAWDNFHMVTYDVRLGRAAPSSMA
uniref:Myocilin n=1 Tax=Salarias fasciatus TaxID=181472 RepID=A0A672H846_SALFA